MKQFVNAILDEKNFYLSCFVTVLTIVIIPLLNAYKKKKTKKNEITVQMLKAQDLIRIECFKEAIIIYEDVIPIVKSIRSNKWLITIYINIGYCYEQISLKEYTEKNLNHEILAYQNALNFLNLKKAKHFSIISRIYNNLSYAYYLMARVNNPEKNLNISIFYSSSANEYIKRIPKKKQDLSILSRVYNHLGIAYKALYAVNSNKDHLYRVFFASTFSRKLQNIFP